MVSILTIGRSDIVLTRILIGAKCIAAHFYIWDTATFAPL